MKCQGKTKAGKSCKKCPKKGSKYCNVHIAGKPTAAERMIRVMTVLELLIKGKSRDYIVRYCSEKWEVEERSTDNYIADARDQIKYEIDKHKEEHVNLALLQFNDLYDKNYLIQDYRECRQVLESKLKYLDMKPGYLKKPLKQPRDNIKPIESAKNF